MKQPARLARRALPPIAFAAGFALASAALVCLVPPIPVADGKLEWFREGGDRFDALFVGSSRTARQIVPSVFDAAMAEAGRRVRSFNLGLPGMWPPEDGFVIEQALSRRETPLRYLIVECNGLRLGIPPQGREMARAVYWHDVARLRALWRRAFAPPAASPETPPSADALAQNLGALAGHARPFLWNASRLGRGSELLREALAPEGPARAAPSLGPAGDGYLPRRPRPTLAGAELDAYRRELEAALRAGPRRTYGDAESQAELRRKRALAERHGARLVLVAPPVATTVFAPLPEAGIAFLDFSDPTLYPELFAPEHRKDAGHLSDLGGELYSRLLARRIAALP